MQVVVQRADLARALTAASKAVEKSTTIPILSCVKIEALDGALVVRGTDLDIEVNVRVPANVSAPGVAVADANRLRGVAAKSAGDTISLSAGDNKLAVKSGRSRFSLASLSADDFPSLADDDLPHAFRAGLHALMSPVRFAISTDEMSYYLRGAYLHVVDGALVTVATDRHRLSIHRGEQCADIPGVIIPAKTVGLVPPGEVDVALSERKIQIRSGDTVITSKLIDGTFPDYARVIPTASPFRLRADRKALTAALERVRIASDQRGSAVRLSLEKKRVVLTARSESGEATDEVDAEYEGEALEIGVNGAYLAEILSTLPGPIVTAAFADAGTPVRFDDGAVTVVLMPMRV